MSDWDGKSKGTPLGYRIFIWSIKVLGLGFSYGLVKFVSFYYFLFARTPKKNLRDFYSVVPGIPKNKIRMLIRRNFYFIGTSLVDRFAQLLNKADKLSHTNEGEDKLVEFAESKRPLVILSAHLGNWEVAGNALRKFNDRMNVVMFDGERDKLKSLVVREAGEIKFKIIPIMEDMSHVFRINSAIKRGETICLHADRYIAGTKTIEVDFFGRKAQLPYGPFQMAAKLGAHYCIIFSVKSEKYKYHFTSTVPKKESSPEKIAQDFAILLETKVQLNPEQWFNYHQFFN